MKQKTKPLGKHERGQPTKMPMDFYEAKPPGAARTALPLPKGAKEFPKSKGPLPGYRTVQRPTQEEGAKRPTEGGQRSKKAQAASMAVHDGLDASMPLDQRQMLYGNAKPSAPVGQLYSKFRAL